MRKATPTLDRMGMFAFFYNCKAASMSVQRYLLKDRAIVRKDDSCAYHQVLSQMTDDDLDGLFKFTIVRNPFARVVSAYHYLLATGTNMQGRNFEQFVLSENMPAFNHHFHRQVDLIAHNGKLIVDFVAKIETIESDWKVIAGRIGCSKKLPHENASQHDRWQFFYRDHPAVRNKVVEQYREDFEILDYEMV